MGPTTMGPSSEEAPQLNGSGPINVLMIGAGEYTVGFVMTTYGAASDKPAGVVALSLFELRRQGLVGAIKLCDRCGTRMPAVRANIDAKIGQVYEGLDTTMQCFPADDVDDDPHAFEAAISSMSRGDLAIIFVPDDWHYMIAVACIKAGLHTLIAKPAVKTLEHHVSLIEVAAQHGVMVATEYHKRWDPIYSDARNRVRGLGPFSYFYSWMSQPKQQLDTFRSWAGKASDISYYLNSHHIDIHNWFVGGRARPIRVTALAATGIAAARLGRPCEDTITLSVEWSNLGDGSTGTAVYTASWVTPKGECHTRQHFHYMGHEGEVHADQSHRGYSTATDAAGYASLNPLYMRYTPDAAGRFAGQSGYGFLSIHAFVVAGAALNARKVTIEQLREEGQLALIEDTVAVTAILHAGRLSLDNGGAPVVICYPENAPNAIATHLKIHTDNL